MNDVSRQSHWENVYATKDENEVSWFQETPALSLKLIRLVGAIQTSAIIDIGGGASRLADCLVSQGFEDVTVLDLSADAGLVVMPLFHVHGLIGATLAPLFAGGTVIMPPRFSAGTFWPAAQAHRATWYSCSPTIHQILLARPDAPAREMSPSATASATTLVSSATLRIASSFPGIG